MNKHEHTICKITDGKGLARLISVATECVKFVQWPVSHVEQVGVVISDTFGGYRTGWTDEKELDGLIDNNVMVKLSVSLVWDECHFIGFVPKHHLEKLKGMDKVVAKSYNWH